MPDTFELWDAIYTFLISMVPIIELRGAIPIGAAMGLPWYVNYIVSVIGNFLPVPFILIFIRAILNWMKGVPRLAKIALWLEARAAKKSDKVSKYATIGLMLFVAIPAPGTGAWTGSLIAALMEMRLKHSLISVFCGVIIAGAVVTLIAYGALGFLDFLL
ncbi:MAG: small multi-drug export protein [Clostridia bacterium]|nr:small multi-drug export protein [Clostridia bacterium]